MPTPRRHPPVRTGLRGFAPGWRAATPARPAGEAAGRKPRGGNNRAVSTATASSFLNTAGLAGRVRSASGFRRPGGSGGRWRGSAGPGGGWSGPSGNGCGRWSRLAPGGSRSALWPRRPGCRRRGCTSLWPMPGTLGRCETPGSRLLWSAMLQGGYGARRPVTGPPGAAARHRMVPRPAPWRTGAARGTGRRPRRSPRCRRCRRRPSPGRPGRPRSRCS